MRESIQRQGDRARHVTVLVMTLGLLLWQVGNAQAAPRVQITVDDAVVNEGNAITFRVEMTDPPATPNIIPVSVEIWNTGAGANPVRLEFGDMGHHRLWFTQGRERHALSVRSTRQAGTNTANTVTARVESSHRFSITGSATVTAQAVDHASPALNVAAASQAVTIKEGAAAQIVIELDDIAQRDIDVNVRTEVTTGIGNHYPEIQEGHIGMRTVRIHRGRRQALVPLFARDDNVVNNGKAVTLTLLTGTGYTLGTDSTVVITIQADTVTNPNHTPPEGADSAILRWERCAEDVLVNEGDGTISMTAVIEGTVQSTWSFKAVEAERVEPELHQGNARHRHRVEHRNGRPRSRIGSDTHQGPGRHHQRRRDRERRVIRIRAGSERAGAPEHSGRRKLQCEGPADQRRRHGEHHRGVESTTGGRRQQDPLQSEGRQPHKRQLPDPVRDQSARTGKR